MEKVRVWRTASEKRRIVELTLQPGMSVARVAQAEGVNSHQVFQWRRAYRQGLLGDMEGASNLLPVVIAGEQRQAEQPYSEPPESGSIHVEFPGRAVVSIEHGADMRLVRIVLESLL
jgi:transposase